MPIHLPPLRERPDDIVPLVEHFIAEFSRVYGVEPKQVSDEAMRRLVRYSWPGNIRELQNAIERAFALSSAPRIGLEDLPAAVIRATEPESDGGKPRENAGEPLPLEEIERRNIAAALKHAGGNKNEAARILGIDRQRLYRKLQKYGM